MPLSTSSEKFTGQGWRAFADLGCFDTPGHLHPPTVAHWTDTRGRTRTTIVRCERRRGHRGWHACDTRSWQ